MWGQSSGSQDMGEAISGSIIGLLVVIVTVLMFLFLGVLFLAGGWLIKLIQSRRQQAGEQEALLPKPRYSWFGTPLRSRWVEAYDYWLYLAERMIGIEFISSPTRIFIGSVLVAVSPVITVNAITHWFISPALAQQWLLPTIGVAVVIGSLTAWRLAQPVEWFSGGSGDGQADRASGGFSLGNDQW